MEDEMLTLDPQMDYAEVQGLSSEVRERLFKVRPTTIVSPSSNARGSLFITCLKGAAKRMEGMTPTGIIYLLRHAKRTYRAGQRDPGFDEVVAPTIL